MEIDAQSIELQFGLILTIIGSLSFGASISKRRYRYARLLQVSTGLLTATGVALVWSGIS